MKNRIIILVITAALLSGCSSKIVEPDNSVHFEIKLVEGGCPTGEHLGIPGNAQAGEGVPGKRIALQEIDLVRVMIVDFSNYEKWDSVTVTDEWDVFVNDRDTWAGDLSNWGEWEKLLGNHFRIVANQTLEIKEEYAEGVVPGALGLNAILVALLEENVIRYWGETYVHGVEGEASEVFVEVWEQYYEEEYQP